VRLTLALEPRYRDGAAVINMSFARPRRQLRPGNYKRLEVGLVGFGRALAARWEPRVRVNAVAPSSSTLR